MEFNRFKELGIKKTAKCLAATPKFTLLRPWFRVTGN
jgi:hypothetical protein